MLHNDNKRGKMEPEKKSFLRECRRKKGLRVIDLAKELRLPRSNITAMENGYRQVGELMARKFGDYFREPWQKFIQGRYK
jgi:transcriptional regulator with XRE-family HTH domain